MAILFTRWGLILVLGAVVACASLQSGSSQSGWPQTDPTVKVAESDLVDLQLRVLALELAQQAQGQRRYYFSFFPRLGKIEAVCRLKKNSLPTGADPAVRPEGEKAISQEVAMITAGISEILDDLAIKKGYDPARHLEIRFQIDEEPVREIAVFAGGQVHWLTP